MTGDYVAELERPSHKAKVVSTTGKPKGNGLHGQRTAFYG